MDAVELTEIESMEYEQPKIVDYGSLSELTKTASSENSDVLGGNNGTAFSVPHPQG
jgi:hypothetical protein